MDFKKILKKIAPYVAVPALFAALCAAYFAPQFEGKEIPMHDVVQYEGMSKDIKDLRAAEGIDAGWTGGMFGGMPAYLITVKYPSMIIRNAVNGIQNTLGKPWGFILLALASFWVMTLLCGINPWVGLVAALAYGLSTYFFIIIGAGHVTKMWALAYAPLLIGGVIYTYHRNIWLGGALTALFAAIEIGAGHPQITYYFGLIIAALAINEFVQALRNKTLPRFAKATAVLAVAAVLSVGANYSSLHYTMAHSAETIRGGSELAPTSQGEKGLDLEYATAWSYGKMETLNTFIPGLMGGSSSGGFEANGEVAKALTKYGARGMATQLPSYWGDQPFTAGPTYIGAVAVFLAVLGMFVLEGRKKWWLAGVSLLAVMLAWGSNMMWFTELMFGILPGYDKFRTVSMTLAVVEFTIPMLGAFVLAELWNGVEREKLMRGLKWSAAITGGVALVFALLGGAMFDFASAIDAQLPDDVAEAMRAERAAMLRGDAWRSLIFVALTAGVVMLFGVGRIKRGVMIAACAVLVCADMIPVNARFLPQSTFVSASQNKVQPTPADMAIMQDKEPGYRVLNTTVSPFNDATTSYFHRSVGGYHGAKLSRYQDLIERHLANTSSPVYNILNTKYFITADKQTGEYKVLTNPDRLGAAWFVDRLLTVESPSDEIEALDQIDLASEAVTDERFAEVYSKASMEGVDQNANIRLVEYKPNYLQYESTSEFDEIALFSEIYYPQGWEVRIDGEPAEYFRANYVLRAMVVPAGEHIIEWEFKIPEFRKVENITLTASLIILAGVAAALAATFIGKRKSN